VDRFLIAGAALLLILEVTFLVTDFDESSQRTRSSSSVQRSIGSITEKKNSVHRRGANTLIWDETQTSDPLYAYDSISAHLSLEGDTKLDLEQDTLVVLEPNGGASDGRLKIRFARGSMRTRNASRPLEIMEDEMKISTEPGTALHLSGLEDGRLHVEVEAGRANVESPKGASDIGPGERVLIREGEIEEKTKTVSELKWNSDIPRRVYVERFPAEVKLSWTGAAASLKRVDSKRVIESSKVESESRSVKLGEGVTRLWLDSEEGTSESIEIDARTAPALRHFTPLPRDRVFAGRDVVFAWEPASGFTKFKVELSRTESFDEIVRTLETGEPRATTKVDDVGSFFWRVKATDEMGIEVRPSKPTNFVVVPMLKLQAPTLNAPEIREPADEDESPRDGARFLYDLLVPKAQAADAKQVEAVLSWQPIPDAEYYVIEISSSADFETTLVTKKLSEPKFVHRGPRGARVFWRVAAGAGDMTSPFSAPASLTLQGAKVSAEEKIAAPVAPVPVPPVVETKPAVQWTTAKATPAPTPAPVATPAPEPSPEPAEIAATPAPTSAPLGPSFAEKSNRKHGRLFYAPHVRQSESTNELDVEGSFYGAEAISFGADFYFFETEKGRIEISVGYSSAQWKPESSSRQTDVTEQRTSWALAHRSGASSWSFALAGETLPLLARKASEEAELRSVALYGANARFTESWWGSVGDFEVQLRTGSDLSGGRLRGALEYSLGSSNWFLGPELCLEAFQGSSNKKLTSVFGGARLGVGW
jgi:hypothetical protein